METSIVFAIAIIFFTLVIIIKGVKIVPQSDLYVIERLGKSNRILSAAQIVGEHYENQYPKMELKDWIKLDRKSVV